jgi:hypothetical protein
VGEYEEVEKGEIVIPVAVDLDGVLVAYNQPFADVLGKFGEQIDLRQQEPETWHWPQALGATKMQIDLAHDYVRAYPDWWGRLPPHVDLDHRAKMALFDLMREADVTFVTSRPSYTLTASELWLKNHAFPEPIRVVIAPQKHLTLAGMAPAVVIDDRVETFRDLHFEEVRLMQEASMKILVDRPYNRHLEVPGMFHAINTFDALKMAREVVMNRGLVRC